MSISKATDEEHQEGLQAAKIRLIMQLRRNGITDTKVLEAIEAVPREHFVSPTFYHQAYADHALPIERDQTISQPTIVAMMTEALQLTDRSTVLEIGTGSGYQTALLARLARRVHTIERHKPLYEQAKARLEALGFSNVICHYGDGMKGWAAAAPYDRVMVTAAAFSEVPHALLEQLRPDGIMVLPLEEQGEQTLYVIKQEAEGTYAKTPLCKVRFVPLLAEKAG